MKVFIFTLGCRANQYESDSIGYLLEKEGHVLVTKMTNPDMVGGPGRFDTLLMTATGGRLVSKGGAEGYQGIGIMPGALGKDSPSIGIALKISDGDTRRKVVAAVAMEVLRQLGVLTEQEMQELAEFGPSFPIENWRKLKVGDAHPIFSLAKEDN